MMASFCLAALTGLLVTGALIDIDCRRLPNWLTSAVAALYGLFVAVSPSPVDWIGAVVVGGLVFALGFVCFAFRLMGGGDVKLMAALSLWAGIDHIALFLVMTSLAGGVLSIATILHRRWSRSALAMFVAPLAGEVLRRCFGPAVPAGRSPSAVLAEDDVTPSLPYGVAIAAGGLIVIYALLQH